MDLPNELLANILLHVESRDLRQCFRVCVRFRRVIRGVTRAEPHKSIRRKRYKRALKEWGEIKELVGKGEDLQASERVKNAYGMSRYHLEDLLRTASAHMCPLTVRVVLSRRPDIRPNATTTASKIPALLSAAKCEASEAQTDIVRALLAHPKTDPNARNGRGQNALMRLAKNGISEAFFLVAGHPGVIMDARDDDGLSALDFAVRNSNVDVVRHYIALLASGGLDLSEFSCNGLTVMHLAVRSSGKEVLKLLTEKADCPLNTPSEVDGQTPLQLAIRLGKKGVVRVLLHNPRVSLATRDHEGHSALHTAIVNNNLEVVEHYLSLKDLGGLDLRKTDSRGLTVLHLAVKTSDNKVVTLLMQRTEFLLNVKAELDGQTPLQLAVQLNKADVFQTLLDHPEVAVSSRNANGNTVLHSAFSGNNAHILKMLLKRKDIQVNERNNFGMAPIHFAIKFGSLDQLKLLLEDSRLDVNAQDDRGRTALHHAAESGLQEEIECLLENPIVSVTMRDKDGNTARMVAKRRGFAKITDMLKNKKKKRKRQENGPTVSNPKRQKLDIKANDASEKEERDMHSIFGEYVASRTRQMEKKSAEAAHLKIMKALNQDS